jgi:hypothetical protein
MIDPRIQGHLDSPIASASRASKVWLPEGRRTAPRGAKDAPDPQLMAAARKRREDEATAKMKAVLDYYAATSVPFDRIATHTGIPLNRVSECMKERGRES